jgi:hypothetical protein
MYWKMRNEYTVSVGRIGGNIRLGDLVIDQGKY